MSKSIQGHLKQGDARWCFPQKPSIKRISSEVSGAALESFELTQFS